MSVTRRKQFSLRATVGYAVFAAAWLLLSDRALEVFSDATTVARLSSIKSLIFIAVTAAMLWVTLQNVPSDIDTNLADDAPTGRSALGLMWGLLTPALALGMQWAFWSAMSPYAWLLFYPAVFIAAWLGGWLSGMVATVLSAALSWYVFVPPTLSWRIDKPGAAVAIGVFFGMGMLISMTIEWLRRAEQRSGNSKFDALIEQTLAGIYIIQHKRFRYVNPEFARIFGYDGPEQIIEKVSVDDLVSPPDRERVRQNLQRRMENPSQEVRYTFTALRRDGSEVTLEVHGRGLDTASGPVVIGLAIDISERRRTEAALKQSEQLLRAVIEGTTDAVFVKDLSGHYLMANPAAARLLGYPLERIIGQRDDTLFPAESAKLIQARDQAVIQTGTTLTTEEHLTMPDGRQRTFLVTKGPVYDDQGQISGLFGLSRDVSAMVEAQAALQDKQALLDRMSTLAKVGGWGIDTRTMQGHRTDGAARILDLDPSQPGSLSVTDNLRFFDQADRARVTQAMRQAIDHGQSYALELPLTSDKGVRKWVRTQCEPIWQNGRVTRLEGAIQDISEVQEARLSLQQQQEHLEDTVRARTAELEAARQEAERLSQIKGEFLANMSHEIRTPLNGVLGLAQIGLRDHTGAAREIFTQIGASGRLLLGIINDILDFSKIEAGKLHVEVMPVDLHEVLGRALAMVQERASDKGLALHMAVDPDLPGQCMTDPLRLEQILLNLLSNAVKFTAQGQISVSATRRGDQLILSVADTGIGMSSAQLDALFKPFEQGDGSTTRQYGGTGLGLSISKRLVELLGGSIQAHSQTGHGTRFDVTLPLRVADQASPPDAPLPDAQGTAAEPNAYVPRLNGLRVLVAEDNQVNQLVLQELLRIEGAHVTMTDSGPALLACVAEQGAQAHDVVLMDIQMPLMDGHEATRQLHALAPDLPVIGQTAHAMAEEHAKCLAAGMVGLVVKPINLDDLVRTVLRHARQAPNAAP